jgi:hypothetical protein
MKSSEALTAATGTRIKRLNRRRRRRSSVDVGNVVSLSPEGQVTAKAHVKERQNYWIARSNRQALNLSSDAVQATPRPRISEPAEDAGVESNARLTAGTAALLLVLLAAEGVTVLRVRSLLTPHVFIGMLLVPPVLVKLGSTGWRFVRYYRGSPAYRRKGPPPVVLRMLGPFVVVLTAVLFASGIALILAPQSMHARLLTLHKASFVLWFGAMALHVLGHLVETARLAPADWARRTRRDISGAAFRQWTLAGSLVVGCVLGVLMLGPTKHYHVERHSYDGSPGGISQPPHRASYPKLSPALSRSS